MDMEKLKELSLKYIKELFLEQKRLLIKQNISLLKFEIETNIAESVFLEKEYHQCRFSTDIQGVGYKQLQKKLNAIIRKNELLVNKISKLEEKIKI